MDSDTGSRHLVKEQNQEAVPPLPASFASMKEKIIKTRPLTARRGKLRPRVGVGGRQGEVSWCPCNPVLSQLLLSSSPGRGRGSPPVALSSTPLLSPIFWGLGGRP